MRGVVADPQVCSSSRNEKEDCWDKEIKRKDTRVTILIVTLVPL